VGRSVDEADVMPRPAKPARHNVAVLGNRSQTTAEAPSRPETQSRVGLLAPRGGR